MKTTEKLITPLVALDMLKRNLKTNRSIRMHWVKELERLMVSGLFMEGTGETIKISSDGTLLDGQHRLTAIVNSGVSLNLSVSEDCDEEIYKVIDQSMKRSAGDTLEHIGVHNAPNISAGIIAYYKLIKCKSSYATNKQLGLSNQEVLSMYLRDHDFWDRSYENVICWYSSINRIITQSQLLGFYAFFYRISKDDAFTFFDKLSLGTNLERTDSIFLLREKLISFRINDQKNIPLLVKNALIIKAWNLFRQKKTVKLLKYNPSTEEFPTAI